MKKTLMLGIVLSGCLPGAVALAQVATGLNCTGCVGPIDIATNAVTTAKITNGTISGVDIRASAITSDKIKNGTVAMADLEAALRADIGSAIADITFARISASGGGVVGAQCPSGRVAVAASCECSDDRRFAQSRRPVRLHRQRDRRRGRLLRRGVHSQPAASRCRSPWSGPSAWAPSR